MIKTNELLIAKQLAKMVGKKVGLSDKQIKLVTDTDDADEIMDGTTASEAYLINFSGKYGKFADAMEKVSVRTYVNGEITADNDGVGLWAPKVKNGDKVTIKLHSTSRKYPINDESYSFTIKGIRTSSSSSKRSISQKSSSKKSTKTSTASKTQSDNIKLDDYSSLTKDTPLATYNGQWVTNAELAIMLYEKYYPDAKDNVDSEPMHLTTGDQGRQEIGFGTADSDLYYKQDGDQITVWRIQSDSDVPTYQQGYDQSTESIKNMIKTYMSDSAKISEIKKLADNVVQGED